MDESGKRNNDLHSRRLSLIDVSSEDDSLILNSSLSEPLHHSFSENEEHGSVELLESMDANTLEDTIGILEHRDQMPQPSESMEPEMPRRNSKYNLRKSLAWDSAFFTNAGVLEPEELSSIIEGVEKVEKHKLPGIQEEIHRSADSISTLESLESESLTLESLEGDLFEDVRASIQKSSKVSNVVNARSKAGSGVTEIQSNRASKKVDFASRNKINTKPASNKPNVGLQGPGKTTKQVSGCPQVSQVCIHLSDDLVIGFSFSFSERVYSKTESPSVHHAMWRAYISCKATEGIRQRHSYLNNIKPREPSMGANNVKIGKDNARNAIGRGASVSKLPASGGLRNIVPRPTESFKSSSLGSSTATKTQPASSSFDSSGSASSDNISKPTHNFMKRKVDSRTGNPPSFGSISKTPSRTASRIKAQSGSPHLSTHLLSVPRLTPNTSPASSISEWSSESSSSSSTVKQRSYSSRVSLDTTSCKGVSVDSDAPHILESQKHCNEQGSVGHETQGKLAGRTPPGSIPSHPVVPSGLPKIGAGNVSPSGGPNQAKLGKLQPESSFAAIRGSSASRNVKTCPGKSPKVQNRLSPKVQSRLSPKTGGESQLKAVEIETEGCDVGICDLDVGIAEKISSFDVLKDEVSSETKVSDYRMDMKVTPINGGLCPGKSPKTGGESQMKAEEIETEGCDVGLCDLDVGIAEKKSRFDVLKDEVSSETKGQKVGEDAIYVQHNPKNDLHLINSTSEKEKLKFEDQVDGLSRQVGAMDINKETQNKLIGDSLSLSRLYGSKDDSDALDLSSQELHDLSQQDEYLKCSLKPTPSLSPPTFEITVSARIPLSVKDSYCNMDGLFDVSTGSTVVEVEKTTDLTSLESSLKENS
uniref:Uncharacterized protein n=1 Tax=Fagus sylvatica TaxID=28930 RepID=A0A2N9IG20_FAGSY